MSINWIHSIVIGIITLIPSLAQTITFGGSTTLTIRESPSFYAGEDATFNGALNNDGTIINYGNLDFTANLRMATSIQRNPC